MAFEVLELSLELISSLRGSLRVIRSRDPKLHDQIRSAASSISLNLAEGRRRVGKDRLHLWRIASGSADEVRTALRVAEAWGDIEVDVARLALAKIEGHDAEPCVGLLAVNLTTPDEGRNHVELTLWAPVVDHEERGDDEICGLVRV